MNEELRKMSVKQLKMGLVIFCVIGVGLSLYITIKAINARSMPVKMQSINIPSHIQQQEEWNNNHVEEELYQQIQKYKYYLDSTGEQISPGLRDSIRIIEELYHSQQKQ